jgi:pimeloyl-ACP methyl ester carboxylesterase
MRDASQAIAQVRVTQVLAQLSTIDSRDLAFTEPDNTFKAVVISSPLPPLQVYLEGDTAGIEPLKQAIATLGPQGSASLYVQAIDQIDGAAFRVLVQGDTYTIASPTDARALVTPVRGYSSISAVKVAQNLEHIARWQTTAELSSPASSQIQGTVKLKVYTGTGPTPEAAKEIKSAQIRLDYRYDASRQKWMRPKFRIKLHNTSNRTLYCACFYLTERFKVDVIRPDGVTSLVRLSPGEEIWFANGAALNGSVADGLWQQGITECRDILKLIACTDEFDPTLMVLGELGLQPVRSGTRSLGSASAGGSLNRLMKRVSTRDIGFGEEEELYDDWVTNQIDFTFVRPQPSTPVDRSQPRSVGAGVTVRAHSGLSANVRLTTVPQATRDLGSFILPPLLQEQTESLQFTQSRASDPGLSAIELSNLSNAAAVTAENPLVIEAQVPLGEDEYVLPIAHDGEFYLPLGYGKAKNGKTEIVIERLSEPISEGNRSVTGSVRIFFQKIVAKKLGLDFEYPLLAIAQLEDAQLEDVQTEKSATSTTSKLASAKVTYTREVETVKAKVADAQTIAIYIHGIFGDTESMLTSLDNAVLGSATLESAIAPAQPDMPIGELYDLVLAFDYENLNTTIDQNARLLKERLEAVGLQAGHGKTVHIIAHSMGGLVSRWFIEREGGNQIVNHLIMLGTPNNGSPWPQVQAGVTAAVTFALNGLSLVALPLKILEGLLKRIETIDVSLDQMQPGSDFLAEIAKSPDPGIPYTLVVGNTSLMTADAQTLKEKIVQRLGKLVEMPFFKQPNDIAVSVSSIVSIPAGRSPAPKQLPTACNHLEYFVHPAGLASLAEAVVGTGIQSPASTSLDEERDSSPFAPEQVPPDSSSLFGNGESEESAQPTTEGVETTRSFSKFWILGIVALLIAAGVVFFLTQKPAATPTVPDSTEQTPSAE